MSETYVLARNAMRPRVGCAFLLVGAMNSDGGRPTPTLGSDLKAEAPSQGVMAEGRQKHDEQLTMRGSSTTDHRLCGRSLMLLLARPKEGGSANTSQVKHFESCRLNMLPNETLPRIARGACERFALRS